MKTRKVSPKEGSILIVDDNKDLLLALRMILGKYFRDISTISNPNLILSQLEKKRFDLVLLDMNFKAGQVSGNEGIFWMNQIIEKQPHVSVVFITAFGDVDLALRSMREGAEDFIMKSWDEQKILATVLRAYEAHRKKQEIKLLQKKQEHLSHELDREHQICHCSSGAMKEVEKLVSRVAATEASVLILGENGSGKEMIAREIHRQSKRKHEIFMKVDLGALPESLFESELFGHKKGAFTDAQEDREGRFQVASGGTLFLDEIGNLPPGLQSKLLSAIQNKEVFPVGCSTPVPVDLRLISATNMPLQEMITSGSFREDLYYRINAIEIRVPPLRERRIDIPVLAGFFLRKYADRYDRGRLELGKNALQELMDHPWPGNIRELEHAMEKAAILAEGMHISTLDLDLQVRYSVREGSISGFNLESHERSIIEKALREMKGNISATASELGINRSTLYQKMKKYGL